jgi:hypothetical protein
MSKKAEVCGMKMKGTSLLTYFHKADISILNPTKRTDTEIFSSREMCEDEFESMFKVHLKLL